MKHGNVEVICGTGKGKTTLAVGKGIVELTRQKKVILIQFLKGSRNGFNFAKKVVATGECDLLILDEVLGIIDQNIIKPEEFRKLLDARRDDTGLVMTGTVLPEELQPYVDIISRIEYIEVDKQE